MQECHLGLLRGVILRLLQGESGMCDQSWHCNWTRMRSPHERLPRESELLAALCKTVLCILRPVLPESVPRSKRAVVQHQILLKTGACIQEWRSTKNERTRRFTVWGVGIRKGCTDVTVVRHIRCGSHSCATRFFHHAMVGVQTCPTSKRRSVVPKVQRKHGGCPSMHVRIPSRRVLLPLYRGLDSTSASFERR